MNRPSPAVEPLRIPRELSFLAPTVVDDLIRVGRHNDGGYVLPRSLVAAADHLVSMGINDDWSFEEQLVALRPNLTVHAYDHTTSRSGLKRRVRQSWRRLLTGKESLRTLAAHRALLASYDAFFAGRATHFRERIHNRKDEAYDVTLATVFERTPSRNVLVKMDIEGSEYRVIKPLLEFAPRIVGLIVEFHDTDPWRPVFCDAVRMLTKDFELVHVHANNWCPVSADGLPEVLELTLVKRGARTGTARRTRLPIPGLDEPSVTSKPDYELEFLL